MATYELNPPRSTRILVAVAADVQARLRKVLEGHRLICVDTVDEAQRALSEGAFELIVLGVAFDESRMFDLLAHIRSLEGYKAVPVVCILGVQGRMSAQSVEATDRAAKALLANAFLWLAKFPDDDEGNARIRRIVDYLILIDGDLHQGVKEAD